MQLLELFFSVFFVVFRQSVFDSLLQFVFYFGTHVAHFNLGFFTNFIALLSQFATAFFGRLWYSQANNLAIVFGCDAHITVHNSLFDVANSLFVKGFDGDGTCIRGRNVSHLVKRYSHSVRLNTHAVEYSHVSPTGTNARQLLF